MSYLFTAPVLFITLFIAGCAGFNQHASDTIRIQSDVPSNCTFLGNISDLKPAAGSAMGSDDATTREKHLNALKRKAHDLGANTIELVSAHTTFKKQTSLLQHSMSATAYKCPN